MKKTTLVVLALFTASLLTAQTQKAAQKPKSKQAKAGILDNTVKPKDSTDIKKKKVKG